MILPFAILLRELESEIWCHLYGQGMPQTREHFVFLSHRECSTCQLGIWVTIDLCRVRGKGDPLNGEIGNQRPFINSQPEAPVCSSEISSEENNVFKDVRMNSVICLDDCLRHWNIATVTYL